MLHLGGGACAEGARRGGSARRGRGVTCGPAALPGEACGPLATPSGSSRRACAVRLMPRARLSLTPTRIVRLCLSSRRACAGQAEPKVEEKKGFSFPSFGDKKAAAPKAKKAAPKAKKAAPKAKKSLLSFLPGYEDENGNVTQYGGKPVSFLSGGRDGDFRFSASGGMYDKMTKNVRFTDVKGK